MATQLQSLCPVLRPSSKTQFFACSRVLLWPCISPVKLPPKIGQAQAVALRLKKIRYVDLAPKCRATTPGMGEPFPSSPLTDLVKSFYEHLNKKDMKKLKEQFDSSCVFEDLAYPSSFKGEQQVHCFLAELSTAMGQNVRFRIDDVYEEGKQNAGARWHLEWDERAIPFTKGCSFFYCSQNATSLLIKKACVFVESPLKPGAVVLDLLRLITSFFDKFPKLAVWFLEKPTALFQFFMKAYKIFIEPMMMPLLLYYTHAWTYAATLLSYALSVAQKALKLLM
ncbi:hypothetical protein KSP39_PZI007662 [Platanthera zijinensis]|uniref:SnoaL-like domain-containing protein n=1 Tax=Platanthera zijinensis TaxID=2320716 RepID=A0AAP0BP74_9ASPA